MLRRLRDMFNPYFKPFEPSYRRPIPQQAFKNHSSILWSQNMEIRTVKADRANVQTKNKRQPMFDTNTNCFFSKNSKLNDGNSFETLSSKSQMIYESRCFCETRKLAKYRQIFWPNYLPKSGGNLSQCIGQKVDTFPPKYDTSKPQAHWQELNQKLSHKCSTASHGLSLIVSKGLGNVRSLRITILVHTISTGNRLTGDMQFRILTWMGLDTFLKWFVECSFISSFCKMPRLTSNKQITDTWSPSRSDLQNRVCLSLTSTQTYHLFGSL